MTDPWFVATYVLLWALVIALAVLVLALYRELGRLYLKTRGATTRDGPSIGSQLLSVPARDIALDLSTGRHVLLFGMDGCSLCERVVEELGPGTQARFPLLEIHLLVQSGSSVGALPAWAATADLDVHAMAPETASRLSIRVSPFAVYVADGVVKAKGLINHGRDLLLIAEQKLEGAAA